MEYEGELEIKGDNLSLVNTCTCVQSMGRGPVGIELHLRCQWLQTYKHCPIEAASLKLCSLDSNTSAMSM
jgi:hypothetical protein